MSTLLNTIFFIKKEHLNVNNVLNVLQNFMLTKANQTAILLRSKVKFADGKLSLTNESSDSEDDEHKPSKNNNKEKEQEQPKNVFIENATDKNIISVPFEPREELIIPKQSDTLFWCLFIIHFGYGEYQEVDRNYGVKELEVKKKIGEFITANSHKMKNTSVKITKAGVQEILSELLTSQKDTSMNCLMALLVYYNINLIMVNSTRLLMLEFHSDKDAEDRPTYVLYKDTYNKYSVKINALSRDEIQEMKDKMICLESYLKPMKAASNYKIEDLENLAKKMGIYEEGKKYKKMDLYNEIVEACIW
jgi:hypothetical protein